MRSAISYLQIQSLCHLVSLGFRAFSNSCIQLDLNDPYSLGILQSIHQMQYKQFSNSYQSILKSLVHVAVKWRWSASVLFHSCSRSISFGSFDPKLLSNAVGNVVCIWRL